MKSSRGVQMKFALSKSDFNKEDYDRFLSVIKRICGLLHEKIPNKADLEAIFTRGEQVQNYLSKEYKGKPEEFAKDNIIEEIFDFLGFDKSSRASESELEKAFGRNWPDYKLIVNQDFNVLVEAEPVNEDLWAGERGVKQVVEWIQNKACDTDFGIATDGIKWILLEFSYEKRNYSKRCEVDLSPFFRNYFGFPSIVDGEAKKEIFAKFYSFFSKSKIEKTLKNADLQLEIYQEKISKKFYDEYMRLVFGDEDNSICLVNSIGGVNGKEAKTKIAQVIVDRLIFIKFIEARGWMNKDKNFLSNLWKTYNQHQTGSFYDSYLKILFFNVLNNPDESQKKGPFTGIKYLNGGLFRKIPDEEANPEYSVDDDILIKLIEFLESYSFRTEGNEELKISDNKEKQNIMSPEILGYIFERTANHAAGSYYTPANVTGFITRNTVQATVLNIINSQLQKRGIHPIRRVESLFVDTGLSKDELRSIYEKVKGLKILDPGCGSGAFFMPVIGFLMRLHQLFINELGLQFNPYSIKKEIVENNLFGVDLKPEAVEIAKLRLWLELVSSVDNLNEVELLPNIEYNIIEGNSLIGFDVLEEVVNIPGYVPLDVDEIVSTLRADFYDLTERIRELSENPSLTNLLHIRQILVGTYKEENDPNKAKIIKKVIEKVHLVLQKKMNEHYVTFFNQKFGKKKPISLNELEGYNPLHWILEFNDVVSTGGFDVILGNPPYVENSKIDYPLVQFETEACGNIYAAFFERAVNLTKGEGYFSYIVPISSICTDRMEPLQKLLIQSSSELRASNFDDRPDKIFKGLEDCRSSIIFGKKDKGKVCKVYSTNYHKWYAEERDKLFKSIKFAEVTDLVSPGIIPKIGEDIEKDILQKIKKNKPLSELIISDSKSWLVYHNAPRYWIRAMDFMPAFSNSRGDNVSPHNKTAYIKDGDFLKEIIAALNSSLFYWFFIVSSDCRDLNLREIENFPFDPSIMDKHLRTRLVKLCEQLMDDYKTNSKLKETKYKKTGEVTYQEFYPKKSKSILDDIDEILAEHYGLSEDEKKYIINFDIRFRMGAEEE
jgi:hypothetical protein